MGAQGTINLLQFIKKFPLLPPVKNKVIQQDQLMVMMVGGPNNRSDYHSNPTNEWFYQFKGDMTLKIIENKVFKDVVIREGESYLLKSNIPHAPQRYNDTLGLVIEMERPKDAKDSLSWYCSSCKHLMHEVHVRVNDLNTDLLKPIKDFTSKQQVCLKCKKVHSYE